MRIHLSADHAGFDLAQHLLARLQESGHEVTYHGAAEFDDGDDFPKFTVAAAQAVVEDEDNGKPSLGIVVGATGTGEQIVANKVKGARAIVGFSADYIRQARAHSDANVLALAAGSLSPERSLGLVQAFLTSPFGFDEADVRRLLHTAEFENLGTIEGWMVNTVSSIPVPPQTKPSA